jgi:hypothetical protein
LRKKEADLKDRLCLQEYRQTPQVRPLTATSKVMDKIALNSSGNSDWNSVLKNRHCIFTTAA